MITLYNTLSKKKEVFVPLEASAVKLYTCGPTVYDYVHIGNLRSYVAADMLRRALIADGYIVQHVKNITDVGHLTADDVAQGDGGEDKIARKAVLEHKTPEEIAHFYTDYYRGAEKMLSILPPDKQPRATDYVPQIIAFIENLIKKGYAYAVNGNVFFSVMSFPEYGKLSGNTLEQLRIGARLEKHPDKRDPWDFALWLRASKDHLMRWDSPWGVGYPGWHIECSVMNLATLGKSIDIHTGGEDNIFPHHEAEIAQSECGNSAPLARYWIHTRHLLVDGQKMSKSKGNFYRLEDIIQRGFSALDLRMLFLGAHYRSPMNFTWDALAQARVNRESLMQALSRIARSTPEEAATDFSVEAYESFVEAVMDDVNTPLALSAALSLAKDINTALDAGVSIHPDTITHFRTMLVDYFGFVPEQEEIPVAVQKYLDTRAIARKQKNFAAADALRNKIMALGYIVEDGSDGQMVRKK